MWLCVGLDMYFLIAFWVWCYVGVCKYSQLILYSNLIIYYEILHELLTAILSSR